MRLLLVLCAFCCFGSSALAQETNAVDVQRLNDAAFTTKPFSDPTHMLSLPDNPAGVLRFGKLALVPSYSEQRTGEAWRLPESGQEFTNRNFGLDAFVGRHKTVRIGLGLLMRQAHHDSEPDQRERDRNIPVNHLPGREPDSTMYKFGFKIRH